MMALQERVDEVLRAAVASGDVAGVVAAVANADETLYQAAFGERAAGGGMAMTPDTVFWIASMTKPITATAVMQLVEEGRLKLDAPAADVIPYLGEVPVLDGFDAAGEPVLRPARRAMTLRHLLTHTSGFGYANWNAELLRYSELKQLPPTGSCRPEAFTTPLLFDPGARWMYGIGIDWAGRMLEAVTGERLGDYLRRRIFAPLGMQSTAIRLTPDMRRRLAKRHQRGVDGGLTPNDTVTEQEPELDMGGGALYSSVPDYLRFMRMILNRGELDGAQVLRPETVAAMSVNQMGDCRVTMLPSLAPEMTADAEFFPGIEKTWGLSFMINEAPAPTGRSAGSLAWAGLANTYFWIDPVRGIAGVFACQLLPFVDPRALAAFTAFETAVYDSL
jgi:methyl acetate hydrolase